MKIPVEIEKIIEITDPIYTFNEIMNNIDLSKYYKNRKSQYGRPKYDAEPGKTETKKSKICGMQSALRVLAILCWLMTKKKF